MADSLYLSLWFPTFTPEEMLARATMVMRQFPFSTTEPGVVYVSAHPIDWTEPTIFEQRLRPPMPPDAASESVSEFAHDDFAITFECYWDLWAPNVEGNSWVMQPIKATFIVYGTEFEDGVFKERGHIEVDFGLDFPFLYEELGLSPEDADKVRTNVAKLVSFTQKIEETTNLTGRVLWSESEENLAQKLISRLQQIQ